MNESMNMTESTATYNRAVDILGGRAYRDAKRLSELAILSKIANRPEAAELGSQARAAFVTLRGHLNKFNSEPDFYEIDGALEFQMKKLDITFPRESVKMAIIGTDLRSKVSAILLELGMPTHIKGFQYTREAIIMCVEDFDRINAVTKVLYPEIAKVYRTTASRVERAIRHAIEVAWDRGDINVLQTYFGYAVSSAKGKPTNSEFISLIADHLLLNGRN